MSMESKDVKKEKTEKNGKVEKTIHISMVVIISILLILEVINFTLGFRFFPILLLTVLMAVYLLKEILKVTVRYIKKKRGKKVVRNKLKDVLEDNQIKTGDKASKSVDVLDKGISILKSVLKLFIIVVSIWIISDSIDNFNKLSSIKEYGEIQGEIYECTNIIGDNGACLVGNDKGWFTVYFKDDGSVLYVVEGNELMG